MAEAVVGPALRATGFDGARIQAHRASPQVDDVRGQGSDRNRHGAVGNLGLVAQCVAVVESPARDGATDDHARVETTGRKRRNATFQRGHRDGRIAVFLRIVSKFAVGVGAPTLHAAVAERAGVEGTAGDGLHTAGESGDRDGHGAVLVCAVAEFAFAVAPPTLDATIDERAGVLLARRNLFDACR